MKKLVIVLACAASPAFAHHEVVVATVALPAAVWLGGIAAAGVAAFWAGRRRK